MIASVEELKQFCQTWFDVDLTLHELGPVFIALKLRYWTIKVDDVSWIKNRLREAQLLFQPQPGQPELVGVGRLVVPLHMERLDAEEEWAEPSAYGVVRSSLPLSNQWLTPINRTAAMCENMDSSQSCPKCDRSFKNGAQLRAHMYAEHMTMIDIVKRREVEATTMLAEQVYRSPLRNYAVTDAKGGAYLGSYMLILAADEVPQQFVHNECAVVRLLPPGALMPTTYPWRYSQKAMRIRDDEYDPITGTQPSLSDPTQILVTVPPPPREQPLIFHHPELEFL
jgi:hypothetical protein